MVQTRSGKNSKSTNNQVIKKPDSDSESDDDGLEFISGDICGYLSSDDSSSDDSSSIKKPVVKSRRRKNNIVVGRKPLVRRSTRLSNVKLIDEFANNGLLNKPTKRKKSPVRCQSKRLRIIKSRSASRSDSDNSDIDLETTDDDTDEDDDNENDSDYEEGDEGDESQEKPYTSFVDSIVSELVNETHSAVQKKKAELRAAEWKKNLSKKEIAKLEGQYESICKVICKMPTIKELLETEMPFKTKCSLMEKYGKKIILYR